MNGAVRKIVVLIGSLSLVALPLTASADEGSDAEDPAPTDDLQLVYYYESTLQSLLYGFFAPDAEPDACTPVDTTAADGETTAADGEATVEPSECSELTIESSGGDVNHGSFLSSFIKAVKASFEGDTPFGHYVREFAKSDLGKPDKAEKADKSDKSDKSDKGSDDGEGAEADDDDGPGPNKGKGNNGNGRGKGKKGD